MQANLATTNLLLGVMAAVSVLEALVVLGMGVAGFMAYRRVMSLISVLEAKHVSPTMVRVNAILDDVKDVTAKVKDETERVDHGIRTTVERVDETPDRVRSNVRATTSRVVGFVRRLRVALEHALTSERHQPTGT